MAVTFDTVMPLPEGNHKQRSVCLALVGAREVSIEWAVQAMQIQFPISCRRSLLTFAHDNISVAKNIAIDEWKRSSPDLQSEWLVIVDTDTTIRWDAVVVCIDSGAPASRIGDCYVLHRDVIMHAPVPVFTDNQWLGGQLVVRDDLLYRAIVPGTASVASVSGDEDIKDTIAICIPTLGKTSLIWVTSAISLMPPLTLHGALIIAKGHEVGEARQRLAEAVLGMKPRPGYLLFWGDDNLPEPDGLQMLLDTMRERDAPAVAGLYHMKHFPPRVPLLWKNNVPGPLIPGRDFNLGEVIEVDGTGLDFVLFRTEEFVGLPPLKFKTLVKWIEGQGLMMQTEDAFFWDRWRETHGKGPLVDTRCKVGHYNARDGGIY